MMRIKTMKHLKQYNEAKKAGPKLRTVDELDSEIKDICLPLTDLGFYLEVSHHNGTAFYTIFHPEDNYFYKKDLLIENNIMKMSNKDKFFEEFKKHAEQLTNMSNEIQDIYSHVSDIPGLEEFDYTAASPLIEIRISHIPQGYGSLGSEMLIGDTSASRYHRQ